jgi:hypothetical protein
MSEGTQTVQQQTQDEQYLQQAQDSFGQSMGRIKGRMQSDSAQLQSFMQQLPPDTQAQIQEMTDSYAQFTNTINQAAQDAGVQDSLDRRSGYRAGRTGRGTGPRCCRRCGSAGAGHRRSGCPAGTAGPRRGGPASAGRHACSPTEGPGTRCRSLPDAGFRSRRPHNHQGRYRLFQPVVAESEGLSKGTSPLWTTRPKARPKMKQNIKTTS